MHKTVINLRGMKNMRVENIDQAIINTQFFCNHEAKPGTVVEYIEKYEDEKKGVYSVVPGQNNGNPVGVLLDEILNIDLWNYREFQPYNFNGEKKQVGSKVQILQKGIIMVKARKKQEIGALLYYDKNGRFTKKQQRGQKPIGCVLFSDNDGWTKICIDWSGVS